MKIIGCLLILLLPSMASSQVEDFTLGVGSLTQFVMDIQEEEGESLNVYDTNLFLEFEGKYSFTKNKKWAFFPQFGFVFPQTGRDSMITTTRYFFLGNIGYHIHKFLIRMGTGFFFTRISSDGGTQTLPNGTSTSTFYMPERTSTARNYIVTLGAQFLLHRLWSTKIELHGYNLEDSVDRAMSYTLSIHYHFGDIFNFAKRNKKK